MPRALRYLQAGGNPIALRLNENYALAELVHSYVL